MTHLITDTFLTLFITCQITRKREGPKIRDKSFLITYSIALPNMYEIHWLFFHDIIFVAKILFRKGHNGFI